jgi:predicted PurR-regulated permease PerM
MIPIGALIGMLTSKVTYALEHSNELISAFQTLVSKLEDRFGFQLISEENISKVGNFAAQTIPQVLSATFGTLGTIFFMYFILYFMLQSGRKMEEDLYEYMPLNDTNVKKLGTEIENMVLSNAIGIPVIALLQGVVALVGYLILGVNEPWFWFVITCITAMLPVVGAALAYVPVSIILFANDQTWQGVVMLVFGFGVIGTVDNFFRFALAKKLADVHPMITVFGVIIGLSLFGFLGLIFGPLLISLFLLLLKMYSSEFFVKQREMPEAKKGV